MRRLLLLTVLAGLASPSMAQNDAGHDRAAMPVASGTFALPAACDAAAKPAGDAMGAMAPASGEAEVATAAMHASMARAATIADPDLAFNCGMIAHHMGAIAMAEAELERGRDEASKAMATAIIGAQKREIADMTARVEALAK